MTNILEEDVWTENTILYVSYSWTSLDKTPLRQSCVCLPGLLPQMNFLATLVQDAYDQTNRANNITLC